MARTLSGHTWSTAKKFLILNLSSLHPYGKSYLGYTARRRLTLLGDGSRCLTTVVHAARRRFTLLDNCSQLLGNSSRWSDHEFDCSALFAPTRTSSRRRCTTDTRCSGTSYGGYNPGYTQQTTWATPLGVAQPTRLSLVGHDSTRHLPQDTGKISRRYYEIC